jgi:hypothetical protein
MSEKESKLNTSPQPDVVQSAADDDETGSQENVEQSAHSLGSEGRESSRGSIGGGSSRGSVGRTSNTSTTRRASSQDLTESSLIKLFNMRFVLLSFVCNAVLLWIVIELGRSVTLPFDVGVGQILGVIFMELALLFTNELTRYGLDDGASYYFGFQLASKGGLSVAVCGFMQAHPLAKFLFVNDLSPSSTVKKVLTWLSVLWLGLYVFQWVAPLKVIELAGDVIRWDYGTVPCLTYDQDLQPFDRLLPTVETETGSAEPSFGAAVGLIRSQTPGINETLAVVSPQIVGTVNHGDTIIGFGYQVYIFTTCDCRLLKSQTDLQEASGLPSGSAAQLWAKYLELDYNIGMANAVINKTDTMELVTVISGTHFCGGYNTTETFAPVCNTTFHDHNRVQVLVEYMTDGTSASISSKRVEVREVLEKKNIGLWLVTAFQNVLGGEFSANRLPDVVPGVMNAILWWMTPNLLSPDPAMIDAGLETVFAFLFRGGVQRTYSAKGLTCTRNVVKPGECKLSFGGDGLLIAEISLVFQLFISILSFVAFIPWLMHEPPIGPAARLIRDKSYFLTMLSRSSLLKEAETLCNAPTYAIWHSIDVVVRVGESAQTKDDPDFGAIVLDTPKRVVQFTSGKEYY